MKKIIFLLSMVLFLFSKELVITKYIENKPILKINFNGPKEVEKILKMDFQVLQHFKTFYNQDVNNSDLVLDINYHKNTHILKVEYSKNGETFLIKKYKSNSYSYFPFLVHKAVYDVNEYFKLPSAKFLTRRIVYSLLVAPKEANIYLADYTLSYKKLLISGGLNIFPKWADKNQTVIFFTKLERMPVLYMFNIYTGELKKILSSQGMLRVTDINDKGDILLTLAPNGNPDVYLLKNRKLIKITKYTGIDVNGKFWGNKIAFISDRYGNPYVFVKDLKTNLVSRVLYHGKNQVGMDTFDDKMVISSRETSNAFKSNTFNLFLVNKNNDSLKRLTFKGQNMFPNFSVDGNSIMFIKRENFFSKIGIIRLKEDKIFYYRLPKILQSFDW